MQHPFSALAPEYGRMLATMQITRVNDSVRAAERLLANKPRFTDVQGKTGVPIAWAMASFEREASSNFRLSPAQGDPWDRVSTHVPKGRGPFPSWAAAAIDAYHLDGLDAVGAQNWTWERACFEGELFNGFGYRAHGIPSPYVWSGTDVYTRGKFTSDGQYDARVKDQQLGIIPMMVELVRLDPSLALTDDLPPRTIGVPPAPQAAPVGVGGGAHDTAWVQTSLNTLMGAGLVVDNSYGRRTRAAVRAFQEKAGITVDGFAGPQTYAAIEAAIAKARA